MLLLFIALDEKQQQTGLKALRVKNVYGNALISAFPLIRHMFTGTAFPYKNIYGNVVPARFSHH